jgi:hypothetical protein
MLSASSESRALGSGEASSSEAKISDSPNTEAVSASVSGVPWWKIPWRAASAACTPWPSSCASVSTSRLRLV